MIALSFKMAPSEVAALKTGQIPRQRRAPALDVDAIRPQVLAVARRLAVDSARPALNPGTGSVIVQNSPADQGRPSRST